MTIRGKLLASYLIVALLSGVGGLIGLGLTRSVDKKISLVANDTLPDLEILQDLRYAGLQVVSSTMEYFVLVEKEREAKRPPSESKHHEEEVHIAAGVSLFRASIDRYRSLVKGETESDKRRAASIKERGEKLVGTSGEIVGLINAGASPRRLLEAVARFEADELAYLAIVGETLKHENTVFTQYRQSLHHSLASAKVEIALVSVLTFILAVACGHTISAGISRRLDRFRRAVQVIGWGDLTTRVDLHSRDELGDLATAFNAMTDDLHRSHTELLDARNYLDDIIHSLMDSLIVATPDGKIEQVNAATCTLLGYDSEPVGLPLSAIIPDPPFDELARKGVISDQERFYLTKDGRRIAVVFSGVVMWNPDDTMRGIVCVGHDITRRKEAEDRLRCFAEELQQTNEELKNFTYIVSHDLRSPLVNIKGFAGELSYSLDEMQERFERVAALLDDQDRVRISELFRSDIPEAIGFITSSVNRMDALIDAVLKLSRLGHRELLPEPVDTALLVGDILASLAHQLEQRRATVTVGPLPTLVGDRMAMEQLLGNVIDNAVKYLDPSRPGVIRISAEEAGDEVLFHIADNGRGIAPEESHKVFEVFRRAGRQDVAGEGMGLAYVKATVRRLGGRVWYDSIPGEGTTFHIVVPRRAGSGKV